MKDAYVMLVFAVLHLGMYIASSYNVVNTDYLVASIVFLVGSVLSRKIDGINKEK